LNDYKFRTVVAGGDEPSPGVVEMQFSSGYRMGARATQHLGENFSASVEYGFTRQALRLTNVIQRLPYLNMGHYVHSFTYNVAFSPMTRDERFRPHVELGTGALWFHISERGRTEAQDRDLRLEDSWEVVFNYGVGFKYLVSDRFALTADFKGRLSDIPTYGLPTSTRRVNGQFEPAITTHGVMHALQLNFGFAHEWD